MDLEGQWWKSQLAADIHQTLRRKELTLPKYKSASPQIKMRRYFADLLAVLSHRHKLCPTARHLAVFLLDLFMDHYDVALRQLYTVALSCLLLASKFEEKEGCVPKLEQLNCLGFMLSMKLCITKRDLVKTELLLLGTLDWNLCLPTPAHFIEYYLQSSVQEGDLHNGVPLTTLTKTKTFMDKYTHYFLEVSLQDHVYLGFQPSLVAASCITASRICLNISPSWTTFLHLLTGYTWDSLVHCIKLLLLAHDSDVKHADKMKKKSNSAANTHQFLRTSPVQLSSHSHILSPSLKHPSTEPNHQPQPLHTASYQPLSQRSSSPGLSFTGSDSGSSHTQHSFLTG